MGALARDGRPHCHCYEDDPNAIDTDWSEDWRYGSDGHS